MRIKLLPQFRVKAVDLGVGYLPGRYWRLETAERAARELRAEGDLAWVGVVDRTGTVVAECRHQWGEKNVRRAGFETFAWRECTEPGCWAKSFAD